VHSQTPKAIRDASDSRFWKDDLINETLQPKASPPLPEHELPARGICGACVSDNGE